MFLCFHLAVLTISVLSISVFRKSYVVKEELIGGYIPCERDRISGEGLKKLQPLTKMTMRRLPLCLSHSLFCLSIFLSVCSVSSLFSLSLCLCLSYLRRS